MSTSFKYHKYRQTINLEDNDLVWNFFLKNQFDQIVCLDVLEHLTKQTAINLLKEISMFSVHSYLTIANHTDVQEINNKKQDVHLIQKSYDWWENILHSYFYILRKKELYNGLSCYYFLKSINNGPQILI